METMFINIFLLYIYVSVLEATCIYIVSVAPSYISGSEKLALLYEQWLGCSGKWTDSEFYIQIQESKRHRKTGTRAWMTRDQVILKYNSTELGNAICNAKLADPEVAKHSVKPHPDFPQNEAGTQPCGSRILWISW